MDDNKSIGIWIRVSTEDQVRGESPEHHERRARYYAESKDWNIKEVYKLEAVSGKSVMEHPETQRMLHDIKSGNISGIIFSKLARLARNTKELLEFAEIFRKYNADLISLQESIDTSTPAGRLFYTMIAAMAQWEREEIAERVAASVPVRAKMGKPLGGQAPFGFQWLDKKLIPDPKESQIRKHMYELFSEHKRKKTVARILNDSGYRTRNGSKFSDTTVMRLLQDPSAKGLRRANYTKSLGENKKWELKSPSDWVFTEIEPIISEELWNQCNNIISEQQKTNHKPAKKAVHLFTGFVFCDCDNKMYVPSNSPKYTCQKCHNKIGTTDLESIFHEQLKNFLLSPKEMMQYLDTADHSIKEKEELLSTLIKEQSRIKQEMDKLVQLHLAGELPKVGFGNHYRPLDERFNQMENQIPELQAEIDFLKIQFLSSDEILREAKDLYNRWETFNSEEKRKIIETITDKIIIGQNDISIQLQYIPSGDKLAAERQHNFMVAWHFYQLCYLAQNLQKYRKYLIP
jgi:site-specific DNA recombinase